MSKDLCLVKVLDYESQQHLKKKKILECCNCPIKEKCQKDKKGE